MTTAYVPNVEIQLETEDPSTIYCFNPSDFQFGSQSVTLDYFNSLIFAQNQADEAAAAAVSAQIAAQTSANATSDGLLASGISITQSFLNANTANDLVQSTLITALEGNVSILQDNVIALETSINSQVVDISGAISDIEAEVSTNSGSIASFESDITVIQSSVSANSGNIALLQTDVQSNSDDISSINSAIALRATLANPVFTTQITTPQLTLNGSIITNSTDISPAEISHLNGTSSNIQSQIDSATANIALKCPINNAALTGTPTCPNQSDGDNSTKLANTSFVSTAIANLIGSAPSTMDTLQELANVLQNTPDVISSLTSTVGLKAPTSLPTFTGTVTIPNLVINTTASFPVTSISSAAIDNSHFSTLTTAQTISGAKTYSGLSTVNKMCENFYSLGTLGSTTAALDFANGSCFYFTPFSSSNIALAITNLPTSNQSCTYSITSLINTSTYKVCGNSCSVNGNATTLVASGGISSLSVDPSANFIIQQIVLCFDGSVNPNHVISSINSFY